MNDDVKSKLLEVKEKHNEMLAEHGWVCHLVIGNTHTHGIAETFKHKDLQCTVPIDPATIHSIFVNVVERIKKGECFVAGKSYSEIIKSLDVKFIDATDNDRPVLRMIVPDADGCLDEKLMQQPFRRQYENLDTQLISSVTPE